MVRARRRCINLFKSFSTAIEQYTQRVTAPEKPRLAHEERPSARPDRAPNHLPTMRHPRNESFPTSELRMMMQAA